ncbi:MAG: guanylate cyclase, partial [Candidatus Tectomicrobia bacterium]
MDWWAPQQSIAVLPFVNVSDDASNEYFSDGISEELLNLLTKIPELRVISRSSAFSYKGKDIDIPTVAAQLNVAHVLEGSVRKAGNQVRINAQLIEARTDTHLWSESYERTLDDIFAIQDEIAAAVVANLKIAIMGEVPTAQRADPEAFRLYMLANHFAAPGHDAEGLRKAEALHKQALAIDPDFEKPWRKLSVIYGALGSLGRITPDEVYALQAEVLQKAIEINPASARIYTSLGALEIRSQYNFQK